MASHSSILAWRIPRTEEPGGLQSMGSQESDTTNTLYPPLWDKEVSFPYTGSNMLIYFLQNSKSLWDKSCVQTKAFLRQNRIRFLSHQPGTRLSLGATRTSAAGWGPMSQTRFALHCCLLTYVILLFCGLEILPHGGGDSSVQGLFSCSFPGQRKGELHCIPSGQRSQWASHVSCRKDSPGRLCTRSQQFAFYSKNSSRGPQPTRCSVFLPTRRASFCVTVPLTISVLFNGWQKTCRPSPKKQLWLPF